jgi:hypothetical protein
VVEFFGGWHVGVILPVVLSIASGRPLPSLPQILISHALIHSADGELFREALLHASKRCGIESFAIKESELLERGMNVSPATQ